MKSYFAYFRLKFLTGLQYRFEALAGITTQIFFGITYISIYIAFYESGGKNLPMELDKLVSFLWLEQAFFVLIYSFYKDKEIIKMIKNGNISYELLRPKDLYFMWAFKIYGDKLAKTLLRAPIVIMVALILPMPFKFNIYTTPEFFILFVIALFLSSVLVTLLALLFHIICMFTLDEKGIVNIFMVISDLLSGLVVPLPFFPKVMRKIAYILPFRYVGDFPFRLYVGNISSIDCIRGILVQIIWIAIIFIIGKLLMNKALKKAVIQGG